MNPTVWFSMAKTLKLSKFYIISSHQALWIKLKKKTLLKIPYLLIKIFIIQTDLAEKDLPYTHGLMNKDNEDFAGKEILILGGGDGALLWELLKEKPKFVTMIDVRTLEFCLVWGRDKVKRLEEWTMGII